jgi:hypothetical protein
VKTRRETLDWLRSDLERLRLVNDLVGLRMPETKWERDDPWCKFSGWADTSQEVLRTGLSNFQRTIKTTMGPSLGLTGPSPEFAAKLVGRGGHRT